MSNLKTYAVIEFKDLDLIDFTQVNETSKDTIRKSLDGTQFIIKWEGNSVPTFITDGTVVPVETYEHSGILKLTATPLWSVDIEIKEIINQ